MPELAQEDYILENMSPEARKIYANLMQQIAYIRAVQGDGGCYKELLDTLTAFANRLVPSLRIPGFSQEIILAMKLMHSVLLDLPPNQDRQTLESVWATLAQNEIINKMLEN